ncbi:MAG: sigma-70 family RNA polymerase sigma factor [Planctomycetales bacterium]
MTADEAERLLVERIRRGDAGAWEECIARFEGRLLAYVDSRLRDRAAGEDVVQETFLGFLVSLPNYDERTPLETYLFSIAAHKLTDALRRKGRRPALALANAGSSTGDEPAARSRRASTLLRSRERKSREADVIGDCLRDLVARWRERGEYERMQCAELLFVLGWSNQAVAQRLGIDEQAVANHKQFVVMKLKQAATAARIRDFDLADMDLG